MLLFVKYYKMHRKSIETTLVFFEYHEKYAHIRDHISFFIEGRELYRLES